MIAPRTEHSIAPKAVFRVSHFEFRIQPHTRNPPAPLPYTPEDPPRAGPIQPTNPGGEPWHRPVATSSSSPFSPARPASHSRLARARPAAAVEPAGRPLKILVLGGTGLIGPPMVGYAIARGHEVTLFNRGKTNTDLFPDLEKLQGDRNDDISAIAAEVAKGRSWDVVIDNTGVDSRAGSRSRPGCSKNSADLYLYTSSISAYADHSQAGLGRDGRRWVRSPPRRSPTVKTNRDITGENYGPLKALCEQAAQDAFPERCIVVRPGLIVGPGDYSDRFTYWPVRIHRGGEVMAPGNPTDPVQFIDCRDLGEWYVRLVEDRAIGVYNGTGPAVAHVDRRDALRHPGHHPGGRSPSPGSTPTSSRRTRSRRGRT